MFLIFPKTYNYHVFFENEESFYRVEWTDQEESTDLLPMPVLEGDEVKEGKGLKMLTPSKVLSKLPISLAQIKAGNNSYKLEAEIRQIMHLLYQHNKITKKVYINLIKSL